MNIQKLNTVFIEHCIEPSSTSLNYLFHFYDFNLENKNSFDINQCSSTFQLSSPLTFFLCELIYQ